MVTKEQAAAAIRVVQAVAEAIREAGEIPAGHLYALMMNVTDLAGFDRIVGLLIDAGVVLKKGDLLVWQQPQPSCG